MSEEQGSRRYPRTFGGLVASMIVLVIGVVIYWAVTTGFGNAIRNERSEDVPTTGSDWTSAVKAVQDARGEEGIPDVVYPKRLPAGWYANTDPRFEPGKKPSWQLGFVKGETEYVGIEQVKKPAYTAAADVVDEHPQHGDVRTIRTAVGNRWTSWTDSGGDTAYSTRSHGYTVLVWGPHESDLRTFLGLLTTKPLDATK